MFYHLLNPIFDRYFPDRMPRIAAVNDNPNPNKPKETL